MAITHSHEDRPVFPAVWRGLFRRCPSCGQGHAFAGYLKLADSCSVCETPLGHIRADDFPPYLTIFLVGHIVVPLILFSEQTMTLSMGLQMAIWPLLTLILCLVTLPYIKGSVVGLMWALRLRGGDDQAQIEAPPVKQ